MENLDIFQRIIGNTVTIVNDLSIYGGSAGDEGVLPFAARWSDVIQNGTCDNIVGFF